MSKQQKTEEIRQAISAWNMLFEWTAEKCQDECEDYVPKTKSNECLWLTFNKFCQLPVKKNE